MLVRGVPPHARGPTPDPLDPPQALAGSPARAGTDPGPKHITPEVRGFPRTHGDRPANWYDSVIP